MNLFTEEFFFLREIDQQQKAILEMCCRMGEYRYNSSTKIFASRKKFQLSSLTRIEQTLSKAYKVMFHDVKQSA